MAHDIDEAIATYLTGLRVEGLLTSVKIARTVRIPLAHPDPAIADLLGGSVT